MPAVGFVVVKLAGQNVVLIEGARGTLDAVSGSISPVPNGHPWTTDHPVVGDKCDISGLEDGTINKIKATLKCTQAPTANNNQTAVFG